MEPCVHCVNPRACGQLNYCRQTQKPFAPSEIEPIQAHSKTEFKRLTAQGANVVLPASPAATPSFVVRQEHVGTLVVAVIDYDLKERECADLRGKEAARQKELARIAASTSLLTLDDVIIMYQNAAEEMRIALAERDDLRGQLAEAQQLNAINESGCNNALDRLEAAARWLEACGWPGNEYAATLRAVLAEPERLMVEPTAQLPPLTDAMYHAAQGLELEFSSGGPESVIGYINDEVLDDIWDAINTALRVSTHPKPAGEVKK